MQFLEDLRSTEQTQESETTIAQMLEDDSGIHKPASPNPLKTDQALPLRRSPRRKSTSPRKHTTFTPLADIPHLVAFSPVKRQLGRRAFEFTPDRATTTSVEDAVMSEERTRADLLTEMPYQLERSVSAPPEEPHMSPRRSTKPRMSDDTALLQLSLIHI